MTDMIDSTKEQMESTNQPLKKAYKTPELVVYGTVANLTEGGAQPGAVFDAGLFKSS
jgi:hypothetical protein